MKRTTVILLTIMVTSVSLSGCAGNEAQFEETIDDLEQQAIADQDRIATLNTTISTLEGNLAQMGVTISSLELDKSTLDATISSLESDRSALVANIDSLKEDVATAYSEGYTAGTAGSSAISTLDTILERGSLKCGVKESQYGMAYLDPSTGVRSGLDISYCRALAAAIGLDPDTDVEYIYASGSNRFQMLFDETIDVLIRTTTWTASRDAALDADFAAVNFYDGQGMLVREDKYPAADAGNSVSGLSGASICVGTGTTSEGNLVGYFNTHGISFNSVSVDSSWDAIEMLKDGTCDAFTGDTSAMIAVKWELENSDDHADWRDSSDHTDVWVPVELLSKEPLAA
ncbi:MAG: transporter substrate-binding domain-containing protein, partial [Candidatus Thalassarchaeaceae archaeon]|nr:transporter substrate-binding domain-containing protein [Candidatus Thalassarchaeaceae archaeon]